MNFFNYERRDAKPFNADMYPHGIILYWSSRIKGYNKDVPIPGYIHWDFNAKAPISRVMDRPDWNLYSAEWTEEGLVGSYEIVSHIESFFDDILKDNKAGPGGTFIIMNEILDLYRKE